MSYHRILKWVLGLAILLVFAGLRVSFGQQAWQPDGVPIYVGPGDQKQPTIVPDGQGGGIITWLDGSCGVDSIYIFAQRVDSMGNLFWGPNGVKASTTSASIYPRSISDGRGGMIVVWEHWYWIPWPPPWGKDLADIYAQRIDKDGRVRWGQGGVGICVQESLQMWPSIAADGAGGAIIAWGDQRNKDQNWWDIYAQRVDSSGNVRWEENGIPVCTAPGGQGTSWIVSDGCNGVIIPWADVRDNDYKIFVQHIDSAGVTQWDSGGILLCSALNWRFLKGAISDGSGGAIAVWEDERDSSTYWRVYAQRVDKDGRGRWEENGIPVSHLPPRQDEPVIAPDGSGGGVIAWHGSGNEGDIYAQRVDSCGNLLWAAEGIGVCNFPGVQAYPTVIDNNNGGAIISWFDRRNGALDVYAQGVDSAGSLKWDRDGLPVCTAPHTQYNCPWIRSDHIISDGKSGAILVRHDHRATDNNADIYAQRLRGWLSGVEDELWGQILPREVKLGQNWPNPFNSATVIRYSLPVDRSAVSLKIYNILGKEVRTLISQEQRAGRYEVVWDGKDNQGKEVSSGVYFCKLEVKGLKAERTRRMVLLR